MLTLAVRAAEDHELPSAMSSECGATARGGGATARNRHRGARNGVKSHRVLLGQMLLLMLQLLLLLRGRGSGGSSGSGTLLLLLSAFALLLGAAAASIPLRPCRGGGRRRRQHG